MMQVPLLDLRLQYAPLKGQILAEIEALADSQALILGPKVEAFERAVAQYCGAAHAIGVSSGTDAQLVLLMALGIGPGDEVATTPYTFFATAGCLARLGARPVFVDIDPDTFNIDSEALQEALARSRRVKAIVPVHLFGQCADMAEIRALGESHGIPVLEDAAQALGAQHPLGFAGAIGEAGVVLVLSDEESRRLWRCRHGRLSRRCTRRQASRPAQSRHGDRATITNGSAVTSASTPFKPRCST